MLILLPKSNAWPKSIREVETGCAGVCSAREARYASTSEQN